MSNSHEKIDLSGEICPYPILYLEPKLKTMPSGILLEIIVDQVCAVEGVEAFVKQLGYGVLNITMIENGVWQILIKKHRS